MMKYICLFFILFFGHQAMAQVFQFETKIVEIDSLVRYHQFEAAQKKTDSLFIELSSKTMGSKMTAQLLEVQFRRAFILDRQNSLPTKNLPLLFDLAKEAQNEKLYDLSCRIFLLIALCYEKAEHLELTNTYLNKAYQVYKKHKLESLYSTFCIRKSSYHRYLEEIDSVYYYARQANAYALKYNNEADLIDSYILLGFVANRTKKYEKGLDYAFRLKEHRQKLNDTIGIAASYNTIAMYFLKVGQFQKAMLFNDSARFFFESKPTILYNSLHLKTKYEIFEALGSMDSAFYYLKLYQEAWKVELDQEEKVKVKELEEQYQNEQKENIIKNKNQQIIFALSLLCIIIVAVVLLIRKNHLIHAQNKIIRKQVGELSRTLEQKQILLSELQHRVKNNLQHVISILEIQKESADFNNIEELIRGNQNRIHSMALLHKKLNVAENVHEVDLKRYVVELSELVKESYFDSKKIVNLSLHCELEKTSLEKALSIGLIIVELVSNSMKHAFKNRNIGVIEIEIRKEIQGFCFYYADNGEGFDFNKINEKGLGLEIIKGLIDQLDGRIETQNFNGFELIIYFS